MDSKWLFVQKDYSSKVFSLRGQISMEFIITIFVLLGVFAIGITIFEAGNANNFASMSKWGAKSIAYRVAQNINSASFMDDNSAFTDSFSWSGSGKSVSIGDRTVRVFSDENTFVSVPIIAPNVDWQVTELEGDIVFEKTGGYVVVQNG